MNANDLDFYESLKILRDGAVSYLNEKNSQNRSYNTIMSIRNSLEFFTDFFAINEEMTINTIDKIFLLKFADSLRKKGNSISTINLKLNHVKYFLFALSDMDFSLFRELRTNLANSKNIQLKDKESVVESFTEHNYALLINLIQQYDMKEKLYVKIAAALKLLLFTGIRAEELLNLKFSDFNIEGDNYAIRIAGKGSVERFVYIALDVIQMNYEYLDEWYGNQNMYFIATTRGSNYAKMSRKDLYSLIKHHLNKHKIFQVGIHIFRHTFARDCLQNKGFDLAQVQYLLGHKSIAITNKYYAQYDKKIKVDAASKFAAVLQKKPNLNKS